MNGRIALICGVAMMIALPGLGRAQSSASGEMAPMPLSPGVTSVPDAPLPAPAPSTTAPLAAPDLPQSSLTVPPGLTGGAPSSDQAVAKRQDSSGTQSSHAGAPAQVPPVWLRRPVAVLDVLDKEDGAVRRIKVPVGSSATEGRLAVAVGACMVRPPDMTPDAAIFVTVTAQRAGATVSDAKDQGGQDVSAPLFRGWLIRSEPGATVVGDAAVTFRLIGCEAGSR